MLQQGILKRKFINAAKGEREGMSELKFKKTIEMLENEYWWGGHGEEGIENPFSKKSNYKKNIFLEGVNQTMPLFMSSKGRYIWCEDLFVIEIKDGKITIESDSEIILVNAGKTLRDAYIAAMNRHFPFEGESLPEEFFKTAQYNTWMEFDYEPTQKGVLKYAQSIIDNGFAPGVLIIDEGWQKGYGQWWFDEVKFPNPKEMVEKLHDMGFVVMLWTCPYVTSSGKDYVFTATDIKGDGGHYLRNDDQWGSVALVQWWNGYSAVFDFTNQKDVDMYNKQLHALMDNYGIDGFKFDGGGLHCYSSDNIRNGNLQEGKTNTALNIAWNELARGYKFHECKCTWKGGGKISIHRLQDKQHSWDVNGIDTLIPNTIVMGLIGHPFICPDMIGGGTWTHNYEPDFVVDEELFIRMAQISAFCPMMQYSWSPWRALSKESLEIVKNVTNLHIRISDKICELVKDAEAKGEPILRCMEYQYPGCGYEEICDQFMLGDDILVAPVVKKGEYVKNVVFPKGKWQDEKGNVYEGGQTIAVDAPVEVIPWFTRIK